MNPARALMDLAGQGIACNRQRHHDGGKRCRSGVKAWVRRVRHEGDKGGFAARAALTMIAQREKPVVLADVQRNEKQGQPKNRSAPAARPTSVALPGLRPYRRSTRWIWRVPASSKMAAEYEALPAGQGGRW